MRVVAVAPELMVKDVEATVLFYQSLGFELKAKEVNEGFMEWAKLQLADFIIMFKSEDKINSEYNFYEEQPMGGTFTFCFFTSDVYAYYDHFKEIAPIVNDIHVTDCDLTEFSIRDNNGYILTFVNA